MLQEILDRLFGFRRPKFPLNLSAQPIVELDTPGLLAFSLVSGRGVPFSARVKEGDEVKPGQFLGHDGVNPAVMCPVAGKVKAIVGAPDLRGARSGKAVLIEPAAGSSPAVFSSLDPDKSSPDQLLARFTEAGILTDSQCPRPLGEALKPGGKSPGTLVVLAADREPELTAALQSFRERSEDAMSAAAMLGRAAGAKKILLAVPAPLVKETEKIAQRKSAELLPLPAEYPESLEPLVRLRCGGDAAVIMVETALAALDAVRSGKVQDKKVITVVGVDCRVKGNYRISLGSRLRDVLKAAGIAPREADKVVIGGCMRGFAQYSLDAAIDQGADAVTIIPEGSTVKWTDEPCVNCGACVAVCPVRLQPHLIGRYSEFSLFDRVEEFGAMDCIDCGLCASVCTSRRPLLQYIRVGREEVSRKRAEARLREEEERREKSEEGAAENASA